MNSTCPDAGRVIATAPKDRHVTNLSPSDLKPGDVLLFHGNGLLSSFIRLFDGSEYSHAAIYDGTSIVEAEAEGGNGIRVDPVAASCATASYTHVYRFMSLDGKRLGDELPVDPVMRNITYFKTEPEAYAYSQILLLGILLATRRVPLPGVTQLLRPFMDEAADKLNEFFNGRRKVIICSELVYQCFNLVQAPEYEIAVPGVDPDVVTSGLNPRVNLMPTASADSDADHLASDAAAFLATFRLARTANPPVVPPPNVPRAVPEFVTPRDLAMSPNLVFLGQLVATQ